MLPIRAVLLEQRQTSSPTPCKLVLGTRGGATTCGTWRLLAIGYSKSSEASMAPHQLAGPDIGGAGFFCKQGTVQIAPWPMRFL